MFVTQRTKKFQKGQSILEIVLAMAIFALIGSVMISLSVGGFIGLEQGGEHTEAKGIAVEGVEAIRSIRDRAWNEFLFSTSSVSVNGGEWFFDGASTTETIDQFTRSISFDDVCRDGTGEIVICPGSYTDPHTKKAKVSVDWNVRTGVNNIVDYITYISNWDSVDWIQTDWMGGSGQSEWLSLDEYDSDDGNIDTTTAGEIKLETVATNPYLNDSEFEGSTDTSYDWTFTTSANYAFDSNDIEVTNGQAQLIVSGDSTTSGDTLNRTFDLNSSSWSYNDWEQGGGDPNATGSHNVSGGNPNGYVNVNLPSNLKNKKLGGFWQQSFVTTEVNPLVTCEVDWSATSVVLPPQGVDELFVAVYLDSSPGAPIRGTEVLKKSFTSTFAWESNSGGNAFDCSSKVSTVGTYYYKIAVWADAVNKNTGPITVRFDNAKVHWEKTSGGTYSTSRPTISPTTSFAETEVQSWDSFTETANKNGGEIYYQLSDDDGNTWKYWDGSTWSTASTTNYNTASIINANISNFATSSEQILFRAFLESDGSQFVQLDNVNIGYTPASSLWVFNAWDVGGGEVTPVGTRQTSGGNPLGYVDIDIPSNARNDQVGGYWQQSFIVQNNNETLNCSFDWKVFDWNISTMNDNQVYVFIDSTSGAPTIGNEVWSSGTLSATTGWNSVNFDCSNFATIAGTYYIKIAQWIDADNSETGPVNIGFDNVEVNTSSSAYASSGVLTSSAYDMGDSSPVQVIEWDEEKASCDPSCNIQFQLRTAPDSGGSPGTWTSWYGFFGPGTYFSTSTGQFVPIVLNNNQWVQYRVELTGDGSDTPILQEVRVNYK